MSINRLEILLLTLCILLLYVEFSPHTNHPKFRQVLDWADNIVFFLLILTVVGIVIEVGLWLWAWLGFQAA